MNPPPLAKRLVVLTATISLLTSFAVLFVAIPKGIDEYVDAPETTTTIAVVKGSARSFLGTVTVNNRTSCAVEFAPNIWIASADELGDATSAVLTAATQSKIPVRLYRSPSVPYLVVASTDLLTAQSSISFTRQDSDNVHRLSTSSVFDCVSRHAMTVQKTATQFATKSETPVYVSGDVHGMAVVVGPGNSILGFVCERDHSQWLVKPRTLVDLVSTAR